MIYKIVSPSDIRLTVYIPGALPYLRTVTLLLFFRIYSIGMIVSLNPPRLVLTAIRRRPVAVLRRTGDLCE